MKLEVGFYSHGEQAGYVGWVTTNAGVYFLDKDGKFSKFIPKEEIVYQEDK